MLPSATTIGLLRLPLAPASPDSALSAANSRPGRLERLGKFQAACCHDDVNEDAALLKKFAA